MLLPGNLAPNKGYEEFRRLLDEVELLELPIRFRVLGRADAWIRRQLQQQRAMAVAVSTAAATTPDLVSA